MAYRAQVGGIFNSGLYDQSRGNSANTAAGVIDAVSRGATTLIQSAMMRSQFKRQQAEQDANRNFALEDRKRRMKREDEQDAQNRQRADVELAAKGYVPGRTEEVSDGVEPGKIESNGLTGKTNVTPPKRKTRSISIAASFDYRRSAAGQKAAVDAAARVQKRKEDLVDFETKEKIRAKHRPAKSGGSDPEDKKLTRSLAVTNAQVDDFRSQQGTVRQQMSTEFPEGAPDEYEKDPKRHARWKELQGSMAATGDSVKKYTNIRGALAARARGEKPAVAAGGTPDPVSRIRQMAEGFKKSYPKATEQDIKRWTKRMAQKEGLVK